MENQIKEAEVKAVEEAKVTIEDIMSDTSTIAEEAATVEDIALSEAEKIKSDIQKAKAGTPVWLQKKIDKAILEKKLAIEEATKLKAKLAKIETEAIIKSKPVPPLESNFDSSEEYLLAVDKYQDSIFEYNNNKLRHSQIEEETSLKQKQTEEKFLVNSERMLNKYPDFDVVVDGTDYKGLNKIFIEHEFAPEISYYLGKNPEEIKRIAGLGNFGAGIEIGKLVERLGAVASRRTNAPKPLNTVNSDTTTVTTNIDEIKDDNDWYRARTAARARKFK